MLKDLHIMCIHTAIVDATEVDMLRRENEYLRNLLLNQSPSAIKETQPTSAGMLSISYVLYIILIG